MQKIAPLPNSFMLTSIVGFLISSIIITKHWPDWGFTFSFVFALMFIAAMISMTKGPIRETL